MFNQAQPKGNVQISIAEQAMEIVIATPNPI
jgi:hypothetical protein